MNHRGNFVDKWEQYLGIYDCELAAFVSAGVPVSLLEIGVQNGGSLELWRDYLPKGSRIVGVDVNPDCARLDGMEGVEVHVLDGTDRGRIDEVLGDDMFDIIIDDGSHRSADIVKTYQALSHRVRGGGKFFIEDLHASYRADYGGGFRAPGSAMEFLKGLVDGLNSDHFRDTAFESRSELDQLRDFGRSVARMTFYDSVAVIEFMGTPRSSAYRRVHSGGAAPVVPLSDFLRLDARTDFSTVLVGPTAARHLDKILLGQIAELRATGGKPPRGERAVVEENRKLRARVATLKKKLARTSAKAGWRTRLFGGR